MCTNFVFKPSQLLDRHTVMHTLRTLAHTHTLYVQCIEYGEGNKLCM